MNLQFAFLCSITFAFGVFSADTHAKHWRVHSLNNCDKYLRHKTISSTTCQKHVFSCKGMKNVAIMIDSRYEGSRSNTKHASVNADVQVNSCANKMSHMAAESERHIIELLCQYTSANTAERRRIVYDEIDQYTLSQNPTNKLVLRNLMSRKDESYISAMAEILLNISPLKTFPLKNHKNEKDRSEYLGKHLTHQCSAVRSLALNRSTYLNSNALVAVGYGNLLEFHSEKDDHLPMVNLFKESLLDPSGRVRYASIEALLWCVQETCLIKESELRSLIHPMRSDPDQDVRSFVEELLSYESLSY